MRSVDSNPELFHGLTIWAPPGDQRASVRYMRTDDVVPEVRYTEVLERFGKAVTR